MFNEFKSEKNCTVVKLPRMAMWFASLSSSEPILKKIKNMNVMSVEDADATLSNKIDTRAKELGSPLEQLVRVKEDDQIVTIWVEGKKEKINTVYIYVNESTGNITLVEFNGNFTASDMEQLIDRKGTIAMVSLDIFRYSCDRPHHG